MKFHVTKHAQERFKTRSYNYGDIKNLLSILYNEATDDKTLFNNKSFMVSCYEKHGYDRRYRFFVTKDVLFVCIEDGEKIIVLTCFENIYCEVKTKYTGKKKEMVRW